MSKRQCYPCTACCEGWLKSDVIKMSPGNPCRHCTSTGCGIYENRPADPCKDYTCAWLEEGSELPDHMRPDLSGVILNAKRKWRDQPMLLAAPAGAKVPQETLDWLMEYVRERNMPLLFVENLFEDGKYVGYKQKGYGPRWFVKSVEETVLPADLLRL